MVRGTTAKFKFDLPCTKNELLWATIKFWQPGNDGTLGAPLPIIKTLADCTSPNNSDELCISLTAKETLRFSDKFKAKAQLRAKSKDGNIFASHEQIISVYPINVYDEDNDGTDDDDEDLPVPDKDGWIIFDGETIL